MTLQQLDDHIITRYTAQPTRLPPELRGEIEHAWDGAPVQLYALADLDQGLRLAETWLARGPRHIAVAKRDVQGWEIRSVERARIEAVREAPGLSANTLTILGAPGEPALALLRYTHRQRRAFENVRFVLEENLAGQAREHRAADSGRAGARRGPSDGGAPAIAGLSRAVPAPAHDRYGGGDADYAREPRAAVRGGLLDRPRGAARASGHAGARARVVDRMDRRGGDGDGLSREADCRARPPAGCGEPGRGGGGGPAGRA